VWCEAFDGDAPVGTHVNNEFSDSTAEFVAQIQHLAGNFIVNLPAVRRVQPTTPRQGLPPDSYFRNRRVELSRVVDADPPGGWGDGVRIVLFVGLAGVGKTALARKARAAMVDRFPDGDLFIDLAALQQRADGMARLETALEECLLGLGVDRQSMPESLSGRVAMFRSLTAGRRLLVVADGITEPAQVRALCPAGAGSMILATSERRWGELIQQDGAELVMVQPLDDDSARAVLEAMVGADRVAADLDAVNELLRLCGGLPLAVRLMGRRLVEAPALTVREIVDEIAEDGMDDVGAVLTAAYTGLSDEGRRAYRLLGAVSTPTFAVWSVAALLDVPPPAARSMLRTLTEANLATDLPGRRYRFLDLVRRHAEHQAGQEPPASIDAALDRLLKSALTRALFADQLLLHPKRLRFVEPQEFLAPGREPFATAGAAEDWLAEDWSVLLAVVELAARRGHVTRVWQLAEILGALTLNTRRPGLLKICEIGVAAATEDGRVDVRARLLTLASRGHADVGQYELADRTSAAAVADAEQHGDPVLRASTWEHRGRYFAARATAAAKSAQVRTYRAAAAEAYRKSLALNQAAGERRGAALAAFFLAGVADGAQLNEYERLVHEFRAGLTPADPRMAARVQIRLGREQARAGAVVQALTALGEAVRFFAEAKATHYETEALQALADVAEQAGDTDGARQALTRAAQILDAREDDRAAQVHERLAGLGSVTPPPPSP
jgi:tetratricopeptide (TPR) repeat protein